ncbi:Nif3-like dinuclear metal center hexameric protein [Candidatus Izimaplasma bacterium ZiA1]|uniref:Nif3-like dinuclear metal center hexameric protein n=1 Tax=Candidatus Izimoplasma sp. ZiA1 TaxID=2024899 RepID=UPI000BAA92E7|nr:Nif3-like dinuclear metal center hexameric protein [Candidatus Izimaplasma bacterium ZiA1]
MDGIEIKKVMENNFPTSLAYDWDNVGLQVGTLNKDVTSILVSLDLTKEVIEEAINNKSNLIIVHHPLLFRAIKKITLDSYLGKCIEMLIKNDIALYVAHTNFDLSNVGMNFILAEKLKLKNHKPLDYTTEEEGLGRIGEVKDISTSDYIDFIKVLFNIKDVRFIGNIEKKISKVAVCGGSGADLFMKSKLQKADILITGDVSYHKALDALAIGMNILDVGHNIEKIYANHLRNLLVNEGIDCKIEISEVNTNPYQFL